MELLRGAAGASLLAMALRVPRSLRLPLLALCALLAPATPAHAVDEYPCGKEVQVAWSVDPVQPCPLVSPTGPNSGIPVYRTPVSNPAGATPPAPAGWLYGTEGKYFVCDSQFPSAAFYHPTGGWRNNWWAYTRSSQGIWGWVPEAYFKGGANDEPDYGLRTCPPVAAPPAPEPPPPASPCEPTPLSRTAKIRAAFGNHKRVITVGYNRRPRIKGRVINSAGAPLGGAALCVGVQQSGNGRVKAVGAVAANEAGWFRFRIGRGVSRRVWFVHRLGAEAVAASVLVRVRAPVALSASRRKLRNGQSVRLHGRLRVAARRGLLVEMQSLRGRQWQTFATTRTARDGRFSYSYRFTRTYGTQRYALRARIAGQVGSPFATGASKPVSVLVRG